MVIPMTCAEIVHMRMVQRAKQICNYFIATNGGIGSPAQYQRLGQLGVNIIFGVDGASTETLQLHRVNVNFDRVIENAKAYPSKLAKTVDNKWTPVTPQWQFLLFNENKHDLLPALKIAKTLGFKIFNIRKSMGFRPKTIVIPVYDFTTPNLHIGLHLEESRYQKIFGDGILLVLE